MFFSLQLLEKFKGPAKKFEITGVRDNECQLYSCFFGDFESRDNYKKNSYKKETVELKRFIK